VHSLTEHAEALSAELALSREESSSLRDTGLRLAKEIRALQETSNRGDESRAVAEVSMYSIYTVYILFSLVCREPLLICGET
jgi:hypothetical protein